MTGDKRRIYYMEGGNYEGLTSQSITNKFHQEIETALRINIILSTPFLYHTVLLSFTLKILTH